MLQKERPAEQNSNRPFRLEPGFLARVSRALIRVCGHQNSNDARRRCGFYPMSSFNAKYVATGPGKRRNSRLDQNYPVEICGLRSPLATRAATPYRKRIPATGDELWARVSERTAGSAHRDRDAVDFSCTGPLRPDATPDAVAGERGQYVRKDIDKTKQKI